MRTQTLTKTVFWTALACALNLHAGAISGTISSTVDVTEDTWLPITSRAAWRMFHVFEWQSRTSSCT